MKRSGKTTNRHGAAALTVVLVCIGVIGTMILASLHTSLRQRRQLDRELQMEQTRWLAEAGINHAKMLNESKDDLDSGRMVINPKLDDTRTAEVQIEFDRTADSLRVNVSAWIGLVDRPETQTRHELSEEFNERPSEEFNDPSSEESTNKSNEKIDTTSKEQT